MDSELPFGYAHRRDKRPAAHMDLDESENLWADMNEVFHFPHEQPNADFFFPPADAMPAAAPRRFQGDGLDFRRPVVSSNNVIDLTEEDAGPSRAPGEPPRARGRPARPPRFGRNIIDVEEDSSETLDVSDTPEIQFVASRRISPAQRPEPLDLDNYDENEVEFVSENPLPEAQRRRAAIQDILNDRPYRAAEMRANQRRARDADIARMNRFFDNPRARRPPRARSAQPAPLAPMGGHRPGLAVLVTQRRVPGRGRIEFNFVPPALNFDAVGFDLGFNNPDDLPPPTPTYDPPAPAPDGFTRSPQEDEVLVCPNCEEELCIGTSEQKRQVWLVKSCGHVYCGECMLNRHIKKSAKGKEKQDPARTKPFKECQVDGCDKRLSSKNAVIQIYL